jgi:hypothetical protein
MAGVAKQFETVRKMRGEALPIYVSLFPKEETGEVGPVDPNTLEMAESFHEGKYFIERLSDANANRYEVSIRVRDLDECRRYRYRSKGYDELAESAAGEAAKLWAAAPVYDVFRNPWAGDAFDDDEAFDLFHKVLNMAGCECGGGAHVYEHAGVVIVSPDPISAENVFRIAHDAAPIVANGEKLPDSEKAD